MIYVIGSGPTGIAAAQVLVKSGLPVTLIDGGIDLDPDRRALVDRLKHQNWQDWNPSEIEKLKENFLSDRQGVQLKLLYGSDFPYREVDTLLPRRSARLGHIAPTLARGGFSTVWGAAVLPYSAKDIEDWPLSVNDLAPWYRSVVSMLGVSARRDDLEELFPLYGGGFHTLQLSRQATEVLRDLEQHRSALRERNLHFGSARLALRANHSDGTQASGSAKSPGCVSCGLCLYGCPYELIYCTTQTLQELKAQPSFKYLSNVVVRRIEEKSGNVNLIARSRTDRTDITLSGSAVFLAAGVLSSTQILLRSLGAYNRELKLKACEYFLLPFLRYRQTSNVVQERLYTLAQLFLECTDPEISPNTVHMQLYTFSDLYQRAFNRTFRLAGPLKRVIESSFLGRLLVVQGYLHSNQSSTIRVSLERKGDDDVLAVEGDVNEEASKAIRSLAASLFKLRKFTRMIPMRPLLQIGLPGEGRHVGGSFPMSLHPGDFQSDLLGRPTGFRRVHVVDSSVFPSVPAPTITMTAMANAQRIAQAFVEAAG